MRVGVVLVLWGLIVVAGGLLAVHGRPDVVRSGALKAFGYYVASIGRWFALPWLIERAHCFPSRQRRHAPTFDGRA